MGTAHMSQGRGWPAIGIASDKYPNRSRCCCNEAGRSSLRSMHVIDAGDAPPPRRLPPPCLPVAALRAASSCAACCTIFCCASSRASSCACAHSSSTRRMASKKQKNTAELSPLLSARGVTPVKKPFQPPPSARTLRAACAGWSGCGRGVTDVLVTCVSLWGTPASAQGVHLWGTPVSAQGVHLSATMHLSPLGHVQAEHDTCTFGPEAAAKSATHYKSSAPSPHCLAHTLPIPTCRDSCSAALHPRTLMMVGFSLAEHIMRVLTTSSGVVAAAAAAPGKTKGVCVSGCVYAWQW